MTQAPAPRLTLEQDAALKVVGASVALSAGAGCGKTTVLAERFVRALEGPGPVSLGRIVALTFTNKAARELRSRIRRECRGRLESGGDPTRWREVLRGLEAARIGTFHSFCGQILRQHSVEAGVDPGFVVFDELIALSLRDQALDLALRERLACRDPDLIELAVDFGLRAVRQALEGLLANRSSGDIRAWTDRSPIDLFKHWLARWESTARPSMIARFVKTAGPCLSLIASNEFDHEKVRAKVLGVVECFDQLLEANDPLPLLASIQDQARVQGLAARLWPSIEVHGEIRDHFTKIRSEAAKLIKACDVDVQASMNAAAHGLRFARLAIHARAAYDRAKRARGGIDNDDLLAITRDLLDHRPGSVRQTLAGSVDLILVDEFQDTDPVQSSILDHLAGLDLAQGRLFLVGDFKQSIYRFRGAMPDLFRDYRERFPEPGRLDLTLNFRSVPEILDFVNALFADTFTEPGSNLLPGHGRASTLDAGPSAILFHWGLADETTAAEKPDADVRRREEARRLARTIKDRLEAGWIVRDKTSKAPRPANAGDITFLFRSLSDSSTYESALADEGLDYHVVGGSGFFAQQEVLDLINVLTAVENPLDALSLAGALRSPFFSISDDALFWIAAERKGSPHQGLEAAEGSWLDRLPEDDRPRVTRARTLLSAWRVAKDRVPIATLVDRILDQSGYEAALLGETLGARKRANARKLVRMATRFDDQGGFTLADFVERLRADLRGATKETQAATTDEEGPIIRLMSIHQAKGLEFPIVVIPDLDRKRPEALKRVAFDPDPGPLVNPVADPVESDEGDPDSTGASLGWTVYRSLEKEADDAEALRLFYVATTRARDVLILSAATAASASTTSPALSLLDRRFDRETGQFKGDLPEGWPTPRVEVLTASRAARGDRPTSPRPRTRLKETAQVIREAGSQAVETPPLPRLRPRFLDLDPTFGLSSTASRLDHLIRGILADPRSLDPSQLERVADRAARMISPVAPRPLIVEALDRLNPWVRTPMARDLARSLDVRRGFEWTFAWPGGPESTVFQGRGDFLKLDPETGENLLIILSDPVADESRERLRLMLSARAAARAGSGPVRQAWWLRLGPGGGLQGFDQFDDALIEDEISHLG